MTIPKSKNFHEVNLSKSTKIKQSNHNKVAQNSKCLSSRLLVSHPHSRASPEQRRPRIVAKTPN
jgi:hypothetical protein